MKDEMYMKLADYTRVHKIDFNSVVNHVAYSDNTDVSIKGGIYFIYDGKCVPIRKGDTCTAYYNDGNPILCHGGEEYIILEIEDA